ncbi:MAG: sulfatase family protein [Promethearchaeota archaeon]
MKEKPNIVLFITHDQGQYLGCYDGSQTPNSLQTPNINSLAENGVKFTNYFCTAPQCSPSRGGIQTSLYPHQNGLMGLVNLGWSLPETNKTLPIYLKENGYTTHLLGLQHESLDAHSLGYDTISKRGAEFKYSCKRMENNYFKFFSEHANDDKPFYVNIGTIEVHLPFKAWAEPVDSNLVKVPPFLPDNEMIRENLAEFYGVIHLVDETIGKILKCLEDTGLIENTLFIYTTDHGLPFPRAKCTLYDPGIKTLLLMSYLKSEIFSRGIVINKMISNIDLLPTILDLIGAKIPKNIEGKSFLPILKDNNQDFRSEIFSEKTYHRIYDPIRAIRTNNYKYIKNFEKLDTLYQIPDDIMREPSGQYMKEIYNKPRSEEELYDLDNDPNETNNLINNPDYIDIATELKKRLFKWMKRTNDPILKGKIKEERTKLTKHY